MPNRFIKEKCRTSRTLETLTDFEERLFWRLLTVVDDFGRFDANPQVVRSLCFPLDPGKRMLANVSKCLQKLVSASTLLIYTCNGNEYGQFINFEEHQGKPRAKISKFPDPPKDQLNSMLASASTCEQMLPSSVSESVSEIRIPNESSVVGANGTSPSPPATNRLLDHEFLETLSQNPAYADLDVQKELGKCEAWCQANSIALPPSKKRFVNWLNKAYGKPGRGIQNGHGYKTNFDRTLENAKKVMEGLHDD